MMHVGPSNRWWSLGLAAVAVTILVGCGQPIQGTAQKGHIVRADVLVDGSVVASTSDEAGSLGNFTLQNVDRFQMITVQGGPDSVDTLDDQLDPGDPSFDGRMLRAVFEELSETRVTPLSSLVAAKFEALVAGGASPGDALSQAKDDIAASFGLTPAELDEDILAEGNEAVRLVNERVQAVVEIARAAGADDESIHIALAASLDGETDSAGLENLLDAAAAGTDAGANLDSVKGTVANALNEAFPLLDDVPLTGGQMALAQGAVRTALADLDGELLGTDNVIEITGALLDLVRADVPTANAGPDQTSIKTGTEVTLDGTASSDPNGQTLTFLWTAPDGITLSNVTAPQPSFTASDAGTFTFRLRVSNGDFTSLKDETVVTVSENTAPIADAGPNKLGRTGEPITINGQMSFDPDGDSLSYLWQVDSGPEAGLLNDPASPVVSFTADLEGEYTLMLTVDDGFGATGGDTVVVSLDADGDGIIGGEDNDRDGDGVVNDDDAFPDDGAEFRDSDGDGIGNFADADEDNDGVDDFFDDFPFDPNTTSYPETEEEEFNDNPADATATGANVPFRVTGAIQEDIDGDFFRFTGEENAAITATIETSAPEFQPSLALQDEIGFSIQTVMPSLSPNSGFTTAVSAQLPRNSDYFIIVNDFDSRGDPSFTYTVNVFVDADRDGVPDDKEEAIGSIVGRSDSDGDGIRDAAEINVFDASGNWMSDADNDGIPNWLDSDSDGDRLPDEVEGSVDPDDDGLGAFVDDDSDGNGVSDTDEAGLDPTDPIDSDGDGTPDFLDLDNDGDGIVDTRDANPNAPATQSDVLDTANAVIIESAFVDFGDGNTVEGAARTGDVLTLEGSGFAEAPEDNIVLFRTPAGPLNVTPLAGSTTMLDVEVPEGDTRSVAVATANLLSNRVELSILNPDAPVLFPPMSTQAPVGTDLTLNGLNFDGAINVNFGGVQASASIVSETQLSVTIPGAAATDALNLTNSSGTSNSIRFKVTNTLQATVTLPDGATVSLTDLTARYGVFGEQMVPASGEISGIEVSNSRPDTVFIMAPETPEEGQAVFLQAMTVPSDAAIQINTMSTAVSMALMSAGAPAQVAPESIPDLRTDAAALAEVTALADQLDSGLADDPYLINRNDMSLFGQLNEAAMAAQMLINEGLANGNYTAADPELLPRKAAREYIKGDTVNITPEQFDIAVFAITGGIIGGNFTGNIGVENDTQLYLSAKITATKDGALLQPHISSYFDADMIGAQGLGLLFWAATKEFDQPRARNAQVEIVTPGVRMPFGNITVQRYLALRTFVDRLILPLVSQAVGDIFDPSDLTKILVGNAGNAINTFGTLLNNGDVKGALNSIVTAIFNDVTSVPPGPITQAIAKEFGEELIEEALEKLAQKIGASLVPGVGQIAAAIQVAGAVSTITNAGKAIADLGFIPGELNYGVEWPLEVESIQPTAIKSEPKSKTLILRGTGFSPVTEVGLFSNTVLRPVVTVTDTDPMGAGVVMLDPDSISFDGTIMSVTLPASFVNAAEGPLEVNINHRSTDVVAPDVIEVVDEVLLTQLDPDSGGSGDRVTIFGTGFDGDNLFNNGVFFEGPDGDRLIATIESASDTELVVIAPNGVETGPVRVLIFNGDIEESNTLPFTVNTEQVTIDFGDNGAANDDTFALFVDGELIFSMPAPSRSAGPFELDLDEGEHTVILRGITAPDAIGTYFISFTGNVLNVSGDPLTGDDLTAGVQKTFTIEVGSASKAGASFAPAKGILWKE